MLINSIDEHTSPIVINQISIDVKFRLYLSHVQENVELGHYKVKCTSIYTIMKRACWKRWRWWSIFAADINVGITKLWLMIPFLYMVEKTARVPLLMSAKVLMTLRFVAYSYLLALYENGRMINAGLDEMWTWTFHVKVVSVCMNGIVKEKCESVTNFFMLCACVLWFFRKKKTFFRLNWYNFTCTNVIDSIWWNEKNIIETVDVGKLWLLSVYCKKEKYE